MNTKERAKQAKPIVDALVKLEKEHGADITHYAMRSRLKFIAEESQRVKAIKQLEKELAEIRSKRDALKGKQQD